MTVSFGSFNGSRGGSGGKAFLARIILAELRGLTPEQFAEEELARMAAERKPVDAEALLAAMLKGPEELYKYLDEGGRPWRRPWAANRAPWKNSIWTVPHPVRYDASDREACLRAQFTDVLKVCESPLVQAIEQVSGQIGGREYESDYYSDYDGGHWESGEWQVGNRQPAAGEMAEKHKVAGLYFALDCEKKGKYHLLPGLSGLRDFIELALQNPANFEHLHVGVVWKYAGRSACSTNIDIGCGDAEAPGVTDFSTQDWDLDLPEYLPWCQAMADLLQKPFPYGEGESHKAGVFLPSSEEEAPCPAK